MSEWNGLVHNFMMQRGGENERRVSNRKEKKTTTRRPGENILYMQAQKSVYPELKRSDFENVIVSFRVCERFPVCSEK